MRAVFCSFTKRRVAIGRSLVSLGRRVVGLGLRVGCI
jgi:hypothetical protein